MTNPFSSSQVDPRSPWPRNWPSAQPGREGEGRRPDVGDPPGPHGATTGTTGLVRFMENLAANPSRQPRLTAAKRCQEMLIGTFVVTASNSEALTTMVNVH